MSETRRSDFLRDWAIDLAIATACAIFLGLIGPFGSYWNGPVWQRVLFQLACFWPGFLLYGSLIRVVLRFRLTPWKTWAAIFLGVVILNAPFQIWVVSIGVSIWPFLKKLRPLDWYLQGLITTLPVVVGFTLWIQARIHRRQQAKEAGEARLRLSGCSVRRLSRCFACRWKITMYASIPRTTPGWCWRHSTRRWPRSETLTACRCIGPGGSRRRQSCAPLARAAICD